jgi:phosphoglycerol transferase MdoB-like AlkP superfamily enzyme
MHERRSDEFFLVLVVLAVVKAAITRWFVLGSDNIFASLLLESAAVIAFLCVIDLIPRRRNVWLDLGAYAALIVIMYGNLLYANYFEQLVDPSTLSVAEQVGSVGDMVWGLVRPAHLLYILDLTFLVAWAIDLTSPGSLRAPRSRAVAVAALCGVALVGYQVSMLGRLKGSDDSMAVARDRGLGIYQIASMLGGGGPASAAPSDPETQPPTAKTRGERMQARIEALRHGSTGSRAGDFTSGQFAGANVFIIQVESFQAMAFQASIGGNEVTPNINDLYEDSWVCSNAFAQTGAGNTADAEFIANASLLPPMNRAASVAYADRRFPALPRVLSANGYRTVTMHANDVSFWNRRELYGALGFDEYYDKMQFGEKDKMYRGASDEVFFERAGTFIQDELSGGEPLYCQLVTLSSHAPYRGVPYSRRPLDLGAEWEGERAADWLGSLSYTDKAVGEFIGWLKKHDLYDSSIIIVYGDHTAIKDLELTGVDEQIVTQLLGRPYSEVDRQKIPLLIHLPGQKATGIIDTPVGQADIMPTVADLLGIDLSGVPHLGRSVFVGSAPLVMMRSYFPAGSFIDATGLYMPGVSAGGGGALSLDGTYPMEATPESAKAADYVRRLNDLSDEWASSLPKRSDAGDIADAYIPVKSQRPEYLKAQTDADKPVVHESKKHKKDSKEK